MPNVRLSESRQRFGSALIYAGSAIVLVGWIPAAIWAHVDLLITMSIGLVLFFAGAAAATNRVTCPTCRRRHWIIGRPTRLKCASCGTSYFAEPDALPNPIDKKQ